VELIFAQYFEFCSATRRPQIPGIAWQAVRLRAATDSFPAMYDKEGIPRHNKNRGSNISGGGARLIIESAILDAYLRGESTETFSDHWIFQTVGKFLPQGQPA
jgi:hypothetical protein